MIALGYVRRSKATKYGAGSKSAGAVVSLEVQTAAIEKYAASQGWTLVEVVADDGKSGGKRDRLGRLTERIAATGAKRIVCYTLDRFARDIAATLDTLAEYRRKGVELHVAGKGRLETASSSGLLTVGIESLLAEHFRLVVSEKVTDALAKLRDGGRVYTRLLPYGFRNVDGRLVEHVDEQRVIIRARELRGQGLSLRKVSARLATAGHLARNGRPFQAMVLARMLEARGSLQAVTAEAA